MLFLNSFILNLLSSSAIPNSEFLLIFNSTLIKQQEPVNGCLDCRRHVCSSCKSRPSSESKWRPGNRIAKSIGRNQAGETSGCHPGNTAGQGAAIARPERPTRALMHKLVLRRPEALTKHGNVVKETRPNTHNPHKGTFLPSNCGGQVTCTLRLVLMRKR
jgi:hypothetical protein